MGLWINKFYKDVDSVIISIWDTIGKRMKENFTETENEKGKEENETLQAVETKGQGEKRL